MKIAKRIFLFLMVNAVVIGTITVLTSVLGIQPYLTQKGLNFPSLIAFCLLWGFGGAFISLALSRMMAKWMMGVQILDPESSDPVHRDLIQRVYRFSSAAGLGKMPQVGIYDSPELNAFATGPTRNRALVAVSTGLLQQMNRDEVDGVLAHEVAHVANGDMVTMTLVQGIVNAFVMFLARVLAFFASQFVAEDKRQITQFGITLALELALGVLGMMIVAAFSRRREYRADFGGAQLSSKQNMIAALERLKHGQGQMHETEDQPALASFKISGKASGFLRMLSTHPDLDDRIARLKGY